MLKVAWDGQKSGQPLKLHHVDSSTRVNFLASLLHPSPDQLLAF